MWRIKVEECSIGLALFQFVCLWTASSVTQKSNSEHLIEAIKRCTLKQEPWQHIGRQDTDGSDAIPLSLDLRTRYGNHKKRFYTCNSRVPIQWKVGGSYTKRQVMIVWEFPQASSVPYTQAERATSGVCALAYTQLRATHSPPQRVSSKMKTKPLAIQTWYQGTWTAQNDCLKPIEPVSMQRLLFTWAPSMLKESIFWLVRCQIL